MADISKCSNENCPLKETCYRSLAKPSMYQSYSEFQFKANKKTKEITCEHYWRVLSKSTVKRLDTIHDM